VNERWLLDSPKSRERSTEISRRRSPGDVRDARQAGTAMDVVDIRRDGLIFKTVSAGVFSVCGFCR